MTSEELQALVTEARCVNASLSAAQLDSLETYLAWLLQQEGLGGGGGSGSDGAPGSVWRTGAGAPSNALGINGDYYLNTNNGDVYFRAGGTYSVVANIKGAAGVAGSQGPTGATGAAGADGATGATGPAPSGTGLVSVTGGVLDAAQTLRSRVAADAANLRTDLGLAALATVANLTGPVTSVGAATTITAGVVTEAMQVLADNTTQNVSTTKHGYAPKAPNDATKYLDGTGAYSVPPGGSTDVLQVQVFS